MIISLQSIFRSPWRERKMDCNDNFLLAGRFESIPNQISYAKDAYVVDNIGRKYIDYILGNLTQICGYSCKNVVKTVEDTIKKFNNIGDYSTEFSTYLAKEILRISNKEMLRFTNSGSEANHLAVRLARAYTKRKKILKFVGHYHGWFDEQISTFLPINISEGTEKSPEIIMVQWNDFEGVEAMFKKFGEEIAAVILEPIFAHCGTIEPEPGFLQMLRKITKKYEALLIFDECITGFRIALGGAQEIYNISADIVTYSKAISGGVPIGIVAGDKKIMLALEKKEIFHASTYDSNPISMAVALTVLNKIQKDNLIVQIRKREEKFREGIEKIFLEYEIPILIQSAGTFFSIYFTGKKAIKNYHEAMETNYGMNFLLVQELRREGVLMSEGGLSDSRDSAKWIAGIYLSAMHDENVIEETLQAMQKVVMKLWYKKNISPKK